MKRIGQLFDHVAGNALARHGRQQAMLLAHWPEIAGELAAVARPEKLERPRGRGSAVGLVLKLRVQPGRALEVQHMAPQLMERINAFFGHRLVARLSFVQAPLSSGARKGAGRAGDHAPARPRPDPARLASLLAKTERISDPALAESLKRLAAGVAAGGGGGSGAPSGNGG